MALLCEQMSVSSWYVRGQSLAMRERRHAILGRLPDRCRNVDVADLEAPRSDRRELIVIPALAAKGAVGHPVRVRS